MPEKQRHLTDVQAAEELKREMLRYSRDPYSAVNTAIDYAVYYFDKILGSAGREDFDARCARLVAGILRREKALYNSCDDDPLKLADLKAVLTYTVHTFHRFDCPALALIFENHVVERLGEFDDHRPLTKQEKEEVDKAEFERRVEHYEKEDWKMAGKIIVPVESKLD